MGFWMMFFLQVGLSIVSALLAPKPKDSRSSSLGDLSVPTAEEGRCIPIILGTCKLQAPNCTWWGDLRIDPIKKKTGGFLGFGSKSVKVGEKFKLGMQLALCVGPINEVVDILVGDKSLGVNALYSAGGTVVTVSKPDLFGGEESEGGISGQVAIYFGSSTQTGDSYLTAQWGAEAPGFRGICQLVLRQVYVGTTRYPKYWAPVLRCTPAPVGLNPAKANISGDCNPSYGIAYLLTLSRELGGKGFSSSRLDLGSFQAAADTLYTEGFGISLQLDSPQGADAWLGEICRVIDAVLFTDPRTGLWTLKLTRADYVLEDIPEFGPDEIQGVPELSRPSWSETLNKVVLRYTDRSLGFSVRTVQDFDAANRAIRGEEEGSTFDFLAISKASIAQKVANREKRTHAYPLAQVRFAVNRKAWSLRPGSPFLYTWPDHDLEQVPFRVTSIRYGTLENGWINIEAVEDIFGALSSTFTPPSGSQWIDPNSAPVPVAAQALLEAPFWIGGERRKLLALAARGSSAALDAEIWTTEDGGAYYQSGALERFTPTGVLASAWSAKTAALDSTGFIVSGGVDLHQLPEESTDAAGRSRGDNLALIGNEIVSWTTATDNGNGTYTIAGVLRGVLDTVPEDHAAGDRVWCFTEGSAFTRFDVTTPEAGLSPASPSTLGGIIVGDGLQVDANGVLSLVVDPASTNHDATHAPGGSDALPWGDIHGAGTTAQRPAASAENEGYLYFDTTIGKLLRSNGSTWEDYEGASAGSGEWPGDGIVVSQVDMVGPSATNSSGNYTHGTEFGVTRRVLCTGVRYWGFGTQSYKLSLWDSAGNRLATVTVTHPGTGANVATFASPVVLATYGNYRVSSWNGTYESKAPTSAQTTPYPYNQNNWVHIVNAAKYVSGDAAPGSTSSSGRYPVEPVIEDM